jgi:hypothetical protein
MVKELKRTYAKYQCERCRTLYDNFDDAADCENRGIRDFYNFTKTFTLSISNYIFFRLSSEKSSPEECFATAPLRCAKIITRVNVEHSHYFLPVIKYKNKELILKPRGTVPFNEVNCMVDFCIDEYDAPKIVKMLSDEIENNKKVRKCL